MENEIVQMCKAIVKEDVTPITVADWNKLPSDCRHTETEAFKNPRYAAKINGAWKRVYFQGTNKGRE